MAFTKINAAGIGTTETVTVDGLTVINDGSFGGNLTVSGVLTYEDVTNVDSVGLITARNGVVVGSGITLSKDGDIFATGVTTSTTFSGNFSGGTVSGTTGTFSGDIKTTAATVNIKSGSSINTNSDTSAHGALHKNTNSGEFAIVSGGTGGNNYLNFYTSASGAPTAKLRITHEGKIGITESSPANYGIHASQSSESVYYRADSGSVDSIFGSATSLGYSIAGTTSNHAFVLFANNAERARISTSGQLRINTSGSPSADLHVGGTGGALNALFQTSRSSGAYHKYALGASGADLGYIGSAQQISSSGVASGFAFRSESHIEFCSGGSTERIRIDSLGRLFINKTTNRDKYFNGTYTGKLQVEGTDDTTRLTQFIHNSANASQHIFVLGKSRGGVGSYTSVQDGDYLGTISFQGADGDEMVDGARIEAQVNGSPGNDSMPTDLLFKTNTGGVSPTERLRIASTGSVGVLNSDPKAQLHVNSDKNAGTDKHDASNYHLVLRNPQDDSGEECGIGFAITSNATKIGAAIMHERDAGGSEGSLQFYTNGDGNSVTERVRITAGGDIDIAEAIGQSISSKVAIQHGGTNPRGLFVLSSSSVYQSITLQSACSRNTTNESYRHFQCSINGVADKMRVYDNGNIENTNNSYGSLSDETLKENIVDAGSQWNDIKNIKVRKFNFKSLTDPDQKTMLGVVAQEAELVCPNLVTTKVSLQEGVEKEYKSFKYSVLYMKAIKCLQEAQAKIETLESKVAALEG